MKKPIIKFDCRHYHGYKPCAPHKLMGKICETCLDYDPVSFRILIIKTGAAGDVLRTTPILHRLRKDYPTAEIVWVTYFPDLVPKKYVDQIIEFNWQNCLWLREQEFDLVLSLDKSYVESSLSSFVASKEKRGFKVDSRGHISYWNESANGKWLTGIRDDLMRANTKHYIQEIFEICGYEYVDEDYILYPTGVSKQSQSITVQPERVVIGLNTGCGGRWSTRLWNENNFIKLAQLLMKLNYRVILLGGPEEAERNLRIQKKSQAEYYGVLPIKEFINLVDQCDLVVSSVTFGFHVALALKKNVVLLNNIFPKNEFHMFNRGTILEPGLSCQACFKSNFDERCQAKNCMDLISVNSVFNEIQKIYGSRDISETRQAL